MAAVRNVKIVNSKEGGILSLDYLKERTKMVANGHSDTLTEKHV